MSELTLHVLEMVLKYRQDLNLNETVSFTKNLMKELSLEALREQPEDT